LSISSVPNNEEVRYCLWI